MLETLSTAIQIRRHSSRPFVMREIYSGSVRLTEVAKSLEEDIALHATHKRLSRNLADTTLASSIEERVLQLGAKHITEKTLLIVAPTDLQK